MRTAHDETFYSFALSAFLMRCHPFLRIAQKYNNESNKKNWNNKNDTHWKFHFEMEKELEKTRKQQKNGVLNWMQIL